MLKFRNVTSIIQLVEVCIMVKHYKNSSYIQLNTVKEIKHMKKMSLECISNRLNKKERRN